MNISAQSDKLGFRNLRKSSIGLVFPGDNKPLSFTRLKQRETEAFRSHVTDFLTMVYIALDQRVGRGEGGGSTRNYLR